MFSTSASLCFSLMWRRTLVARVNPFGQKGHFDLSSIGTCCTLDGISSIVSCSEDKEEGKECEEGLGDEDDEEADNAFVPDWLAPPEVSLTSDPDIIFEPPDPNLTANTLEEENVQEVNCI